MIQEFTAWLRGVVDPACPAFIAVPRSVMRALPWGRRLRVHAQVNGYMLTSTIMNVGFGPSLLVPASARRAMAVELNERVDVRITLALT